MLELRPNCECCDKDLLPESKEAYICSFECTFCVDCVAQRLNASARTAEGNWCDVQYAPKHPSCVTLHPYKQ
jgi:hypothetical protein